MWTSRSRWHGYNSAQHRGGLRAQLRWLWWDTSRQGRSDAQQLHRVLTATRGRVRRADEAAAEEWQLDCGGAETLEQFFIWIFELADMYVDSIEAGAQCQNVLRSCIPSATSTAVACQHALQLGTRHHRKVFQEERRRRHRDQTLSYQSCRLVQRRPCCCPTPKVPRLRLPAQRWSE